MAGHATGAQLATGDHRSSRPFAFLRCSVPENVTEQRRNEA
jgi:hypothetical protein